jgi:peptidoglycan/LPS O-acetylase OafA/YrhL
MPAIIDYPLFNNQQFFPNIVHAIEYPALLLFLLFLSNFALVFFKPVVCAGQSWSVSVEEQFYLLWPWIIQKIETHKMLLYCIIFILFGKVCFDLTLEAILGYAHWLTKCSRFFQMEFMMVGAIGAIVLFNNWHQKIKVVIEHRGFIFFMSGLLFFELFTNVSSIFIAFQFLYFIYILVTKKIEIKLLKQLGNVSYGIYMFHPLAMVLSYSLSLSVFRNFDIKFNVLYYTLTIFLTLLMSFISFKYFESYFLRIKSKYTVIESKILSIP